MNGIKTKKCNSKKTYKGTLITDSLHLLLFSI